MSLPVVGIKLVADGYAQYLAQLAQVNKAQQETFKRRKLSTDFKTASAEVQAASQRMAQAMKANGTAATTMATQFNTAAKSAESLSARIAAAAAAAESSRLKLSGSLNARLMQAAQAKDIPMPATMSRNTGLNKFDQLANLRNNIGNSPIATRGAEGGALAAFDSVTQLRSKLGSTVGIFTQFKDVVSGQAQVLRTFASGAMEAAGGIGGMASSLLNAIPSFLKWAGVLTAAYQAYQFFKQSGDIAQRNETLAVSLEETGKQAGYSGEQIAWAMEQLKKQGITTSAASASLTRMARANISWAEASKLAAIAQGSAVAAGMNSSEAFNRLILGVQKMEPELLDELGITLQRSQAYKKFADDLGIAESALTQQQKQQAILNSIYAQSEGVMNVYAAAMETSGKKQGSLTRYIEEAQAELGKLQLPFRAFSIDLQTNFWKGISMVAKGLSSWQPVMDGIVAVMKKLGPLVGGIMGPMAALGTVGEDNWEKLGRGIHELGHTFAMTAVFILATYDTLAQNTKVFTDATLDEWIEMANFVANPMAFVAGRMAAGLLTGTEVSKLPEMGTKLGAGFGENLLKALNDVKKTVPAMFKSWDEVNAEVPEVDLKVNVKVDKEIEALEKQKALLEQQVEVYKQIDKIVEATNQKSKEINDNYDKQLAKLREDAAEQEIKLRQDTEKNMSKTAADGEKQRQKLIQDANKSRIREEQQANKALARERERFLLSQKHAYEQFKLQETRLIAEGDVLGVKELRENQELERKQASENFELSQKEAQEDVEERKKIQADDLQQQLRDLDNSIAERMMEIQTSYEDELKALQIANKERADELAANRDEQLRLTQEGQRKQLEELGKALFEEGKITEEGMQAIHDKMAEVMGESGSADALMKGFADRTKTQFEQVASDTVDAIKKIDDAIKAAMTGPATSAFANGENAAFANAPSPALPGAPNIGNPFGSNPLSPQKGFGSTPYFNQNISNAFGAPAPFMNSYASDATGASGYGPTPLMEKYKEALNEVITAEQKERLASIEAYNEKQKEILKVSLEEQAAALSATYGPGTGIAYKFLAAHLDDVKAAYDSVYTYVGDMMKSLSDATKTAQADSTSGTGDVRPGSRTGLVPQRQMRQGGMGVVRGPATFQVEPGQREAVMFAPLPTAGSNSALNVNMSGGFNISGAEVAGRASTEAALDKMVEEFSIAVRRLGRR